VSVGIQLFIVQTSVKHLPPHATKEYNTSIY